MAPEHNGHYGQDTGGAAAGQQWPFEFPLDLDLNGPGPFLDLGDMMLGDSPVGASV